MKKTLFLLVIFFVLAGGLYSFRLRPETPAQENFIAENTVEEESEEPKIELPTRLIIPSIGVSSEIEHVGLDSENNMDVPKKAENVAWYNLGPKPGETGSAVIAGHLDDPSGNPAVFWELTSLQAEDIIEVEDENGKVMTFTVYDKKTYPYDKFPLQEVFADFSGKKLNLITCGGTWNKNEQTYTERTVVYSKLKE